MALVLSVSDAPPPPPGSTRASRLGRYLVRMFPPWVLVPSGIGNVLSIHWTLDALSGRTPTVDWRTVCTSVVVVLFMLLMRMYDELKDVETDLRLGKAGDPRYTDRPIVTGEVQVGDIVWLRWAATAAVVAAAAPLLWPSPLLPGLLFAAAFGLTWLSLHWFFLPAISKNLLLAFVSHNPLSLVISTFVVAAWVGGHDPVALGGWTALLLLGQWLPVAAWETARKVRAPADETDYVTYSKTIGLSAAAIVPGVLAAVAAAALGAVSRRAGLGPVYQVGVMASALLLLVRGLQCAVGPTTARANLRPIAELFAVVAGAGLCVALGGTHGVRLG